MEMSMKIQINDPKLGWLDAADLSFDSEMNVTLDYDVEYASKFLGENGFRSLSVTLPVSLDYPSYKGSFPGFLLDLIPQGKSLKKVLARYNIPNENSFKEILTKVPLASPGNIRIYEPWRDIEIERPKYNQKGFELKDILERSDGFIDYMIESSAPIGGTTGAQGGAPKFLLRKDFNDRFHADGFLDDDKTAECFLIKFPIDAADNSVEINKTEKIFYDYLIQSPLKTHKPLEIYDGILFSKRFDRIRSEKDNLLHYFGLETIYSLMGRNTFASSLFHEDVLASLMEISTDPVTDAVEYFCRDIINRAFCNTDNHGRNTSLLKDTDGSISLSPLYDIAAMKLFKGDSIIELTNWKDSNKDLRTRLEWLSETCNLGIEDLKSQISWIIPFLEEFIDDFQKHQLPKEFINRITDSSKKQIDSLKGVM
jgi:serine/threonine-protein kinase HipA